MSVFCSNCGKENPLNAKKCVFCNEKINVEKPTSVKLKIPSEIDKQTIITIIGVVIAIILLVFLLFGGGRVPNVVGVTEDTAKQILTEKGYSPVIVYENDNSQPAGCVVGTNPGYGSRLGDGGQVTVYVSAGKTNVTDAVLHWYHVTGSTDDDYNFSTPYVQNNYLYIDMEMQLQTNYSVLLRGFGYASINDTYDKTVPIDYEYEKVEVVKGEYQNITVRIPLSDLENQRPTTIYFKLATYVGGRNEEIRFEIDMTW